MDVVQSKIFEPVVRGRIETIIKTFSLFVDFQLENRCTQHLQFPSIEGMPIYNLDLLLLVVVQRYNPFKAFVAIFAVLSSIRTEHFNQLT